MQLSFLITTVNPVSLEVYCSKLAIFCYASVSEDVTGIDPNQNCVLKHLVLYCFFT